MYGYTILLIFFHQKLKSANNYNNTIIINPQIPHKAPEGLQNLLYRQASTS